MIVRVTLCLVALFLPTLATAACVVQQRAVVKLQIVDTIVLAPVVVNGVTGNFILDTGAQRTVVTPDAVSHFGLALDEWTATTMLGIGGIERRRDADPRSVELGGVALHRRSLARDATLRVATLPRTMAGGQQIDGLLGRDFLSLFDLDLDFPRRTLTLYDVDGCAGRFLPWTEPYLSVVVENPAESALVVPLAVDGVPLRALLDSGTSQSLVSRSGMARLQLSLEQLQDDPSPLVSGAGPHPVIMRQHKFRTLEIGSQSFAGPVFLVASILLPYNSDMLLGGDWLLGRRVWISYATKQLFATK
jgi:Aspartyl protease